MRVATVSWAFGTFGGQFELQGLQQLALKVTGVGHLARRDLTAGRVNQFHQAELVQLVFRSTLFGGTWNGTLTL